MALYNDIIPKGTIIVGDGVTRGGLAVTVPADNQVLQADAGATSGISWTAAPTLLNTDNNGTVNTGVTAVEQGDGFNHVTTLTVSQLNSLTLADNAAICDGYLLYTLPAGVCVIDYAYMTMGITAGSAQLQADQPETGLGTVIGTGGVATLATATFENIITAQTAADSNGTATVKTLSPSVINRPLIIETGDAHTVHFNVAATWSDDTTPDLTCDIAGTVVLAWRFLA